MQTILSNGPAANRFNIVLLSEGYTAAQLPAFRADATNMFEALLRHAPYQEYRPYFNVFAISVASLESGSDPPANGTSANTYFNSSYDAFSDRLITVPANSTGQGKIDNLLQAFLPAADLSILLVNDLVPGGSDGAQKTAVVSRGPSPDYMSGILGHESGHVVAGLGDEYDSAFPGFPDIEEPNTTRETRRDFIKWKRWILDATPVPTPPLFQYSEDVGLFEGAHYHTKDWYRPKLNCMMRDNVSPLCEVCAEALVLSWYGQVRPVDVFTPATTNLPVISPETLTFGLTPLLPTSHTLRVQWFTNSVALPGATNSVIHIPPLALRPGTNLVRVSVTDPTPFVRNDPVNLLKQEIAWMLDVSIVILELDSPIWVSGDKFAFRIRGNAPNGVVIQSSTNLLQWSSLSTNSLQTGEAWCTNNTGQTLSPGFYRALARP